MISTLSEAKKLAKMEALKHAFVAVLRDGQVYGCKTQDQFEAIVSANPDCFQVKGEVLRVAEEPTTLQEEAGKKTKKTKE